MSIFSMHDEFQHNRLLLTDFQLFQMLWTCVMSVTKIHDFFLSREKFNFAGYKTSVALLVSGGASFQS